MILKTIARCVVGGMVGLALSGGVQARPFKAEMREHANGVEIDFSLEDTLNQLAEDFGVDWEALKPGRGLVSVTLKFAFDDAWATSPIREDLLGLKGLLEDLKVTPTAQRGSVSFLIESRQGQPSLREFGENLAFSSLVVEKPKEKEGHLHLMMVKFGGQEIQMFDDAGDPAALLSMTIPVPEPGTYALMGAGLGLVGFTAWRRRRLSGA